MKKLIPLLLLLALVGCRTITTKQYIGKTLSANTASSFLNGTATRITTDSISVLVDGSPLIMMCREAWLIKVTVIDDNGNSVDNTHYIVVGTDSLRIKQ